MEFSFVEVLDFFFKAHKVSNLKYDPKLKSIMYFIEHYVYKQRGARNFVPQKFQSLGRELVNLTVDETADRHADQDADTAHFGSVASVAAA